MKKNIIGILLIGCLFSFSSCCTYINTAELRTNYEKKIHNTRFLGKVLFKIDKRKQDTYDNVNVYMNENEVGKEFEVVAFGSYKPFIIPLLKPERPTVEKKLLWKAARKARKLDANGVIIDSKNDFRVIKVK